MGWGLRVASDQAKELRRQGIAAAKAGQADQARQFLQQSLRIEPRNEAAWLWLVSLARDQRERFFFLNRLLEINPNNEMAQQALQSLGMTREQLAQQVSSLPTRPDNRATLAASAQTPGIPIPDAQRISQIQDEVDAIVREYLTTIESEPGITWVQKTRGRAGERDILALRAYIGAGVLAALVVLFIVGYTVVWNTPALRGIVFVPTPTLTPTRPPPTSTPTPTPGVTPTPSPTPEVTLTPSPTVPANIQNGELIPPQPTALFPPAFEKGVVDSVSLINRGLFEEAIPTLQVEITRVASSFDVGPYFYKALAEIGAGELEAAKQTMLDAQRRLTDTADGNTRAVVNGGLAYTNLKLAEAALEEDNSSAVASFLIDAEQQSEIAIQSSPRFELAYLTLAKTYRLQNDEDGALQVLDRGLAIPELASNVNLLVEKAEIYFEQGEYDLAAYQTFLALYVDPTTEPAHILRIRVAMEQNDPGLAVLYTQAYLFYYPGSVEAYRLLGDARAAENKIDLALEAYTQGLAGGDDAGLLLARARLYNSQRRYDAAREDLGKAFSLTSDPEIRAERMLAAYNAGNYATAKSDAAALLGENVIPDSAIKLLQARILVDEADEDEDEAFEAALELLDEINDSLTNDQLAAANEYRGWAHYRLRQFGNALTAVNAALGATETGSRHYLRGLIFEAQGRDSAALREYDWVLTWGRVYPYPFLRDVETRAEALR